MSGTDAPSAPPLAHGWAGAASGPVTVVLHGGGPGCHATSDFGAVLAALPQRRWLWADLPGYGASPAPRSARGGVEGAADALALLLDGLGSPQVDVLAQSFGGTVALRLAAARPELIRRIVLIGSQPSAAPGGTSGLRTDPHLASRARAAYYGGTGPTPAKMRTLLAELEWYDADAIPEPTVRARFAASTTADALARAHVTAPAADLGPQLGSVDAPVLVTWGRHDPFAGPDYAAALADALPRGDLAVVGRAAHHPQAERPALVAALANAFLGATPSPLTSPSSSRS
ncbi:alpha/beta hydrolase [Streptomyces sp. NPDC002928]|uniref:alpha/beta fold hydrolase n=1 Tax=Streptomyces sp. NPDC002928 TaxID=3154440 RepID=UPI0033BBB61D